MSKWQRFVDNVQRALDPVGYAWRDYIIVLESRLENVQAQRDALLDEAMLRGEREAKNKELECQITMLYDELSTNGVHEEGCMSEDGHGGCDCSLGDLLAATSETARRYNVGVAAEALMDASYKFDDKDSRENEMYLWAGYSLGDTLRYMATELRR